MRYNQLGKSDIKVSEIGFGCMSLERDEDVNRRIVDEAISAGINFFDTADLYDKGENEERVGRLLRGRRSDCIIATKVGNRWKEDGSGWDWAPGKDYILKAVEDSLRRLNTDYIDLYQLHGGTMEDPIDDIIEAFTLLVQQGKIRAYGISSIRPQVIREYTSKSAISSVMMQYSLLDRRPEESVLKLLQEQQISVLARGSLAQGLLVDKPSREYLNYSPEEVETAAKAIRFVAGSKRSTSQTAIMYVLKKHMVTSAIVGVRTLEQLRDVIETAAAPELTSAEHHFLSESLKAGVYDKFR